MIASPDTSSVAYLQPSIELFNRVARQFVMVKFDVPTLTSALQSLAHGFRDCQRADETQPNSQPPIHWVQILRANLLMIQGATACLQIPATSLQLNQFIDRINQAPVPSYAEMIQRIERIRTSLEAELPNKLFMFIPPERANYFDQSRFDPEVATKFPDSAVEIEEAGKCFSAGRYTATVFHLMRIMEIGLRWLATRMKVSMTIQTTKPWGRIIEQIKKQLNHKSKRTQDRYGPAVAYFEGAKDGWRNPVSHSSVVYSEEEARAIYGATVQFMNKLATLV